MNFIENNTQRLIYEYLISMRVLNWKDIRIRVVYREHLEATSYVKREKFNQFTQDSKL